MAWERGRTEDDLEAIVCSLRAISLLLSRYEYELEGSHFRRQWRLAEEGGAQTPQFFSGRTRRNRAEPLLLPSLSARLPASLPLTRNWWALIALDPGEEKRWSFHTARPTTSRR